MHHNTNNRRHSNQNQLVKNEIIKTLQRMLKCGYYLTDCNYNIVFSYVKYIASYLILIDLYKYTCCFILF